MCFVHFLKVVLSDQNQIIENHQLPQIVYQQNAQPNQQTIHTDGQIHYIVQEDDIQNDNFNNLAQQVYYQKISTENGQQIIQHHGNFPQFDSVVEII